MAGTPSGLIQEGGGSIENWTFRSSQLHADPLTRQLPYEVPRPKALNPTLNPPKALTVSYTAQAPTVNLKSNLWRGGGLGFGACGGLRAKGVGFLRRLGPCFVGTGVS